VLWKTVAFAGLLPFLLPGVSAGQSGPLCGGFGGPLQLAVDLSYDPFDPVVGTFCMEGIDGGDPRDGGTATLVTDSVLTTGTLSGPSTKVNEVRRVDPVTGHPIGEEPAGNLGVFLSLDYATTGFSDFDPTLGALRIFNSQNKTGTPSVTVAASVANLVAGDATGLVFGAFLGVAVPGGPCDPSDVATGTLCNPLVQLSNDVTGGGVDVDGAPLTFAEAVAAGLTPTPVDGAVLYTAGLQGLLSDEQEALLGCGLFYGTFCDGHGTDSFNMELSALLVSLLQRTDSFFGDDSSVPQPGTVGHPGEPICTRLDDGQTAVLPGCRGLVDVGPDGVPDTLDEILAGTGDDTFEAGYDPLVDGTTTGPGPISAGFGRQHPFTGQFFGSEVAVLSFNAMMSFVAFSTPPAMVDTNGDDIPDFATDVNGDGWPDPAFISEREFDATDPSFAATNGFDDDGNGVVDDPGEGNPDLIGPFRKNGCSFIFPSACFGVSNVTTVATRELPDDPSGPPVLRWVWETGVEYSIHDASGDLVEFFGPPPWVLHAGAVEFPDLPPGFEPPEALSPQAAQSPMLFGMGVLLEPPDPIGDPCLPTFPVPASPLIVPSPPGCPAIGSAFVVPEPSRALQGLVAVAAAVVFSLGRSTLAAREG
jgi:hypothetical protein